MTEKGELEPKHFLITGGSGFLGINLIRYLLKRGHKITSIDFAPFEYEDCRDKITIVDGDIRDLDKVKEAFKDVNMVVHCAAALPLYSPEDIMTTDVDGTRNILQGALDHGVERALHISSTAVYGIPDHHPLVEDDRQHGVGPYGEAKVLAEKVALEFRGKGLCVPIIRPKSFIGPERLGVFAMFYEWAHEGRGFPMIGNGKNPYQFLDVDDLCDAIYLCFTQDRKVANDTYNIGAKIFTTMGEDYQAVLDYAGHGKKIKGFPAAPMIWTLRFLELLKLSPLYKWVYETAACESFVSIEKAEKQLGFKPKYSNKDALIRNYKWYVEHMDKFKHTSGISHRAPWKQGILSLVKHFF